MPILLLSPRGTTAEITREFKPPSYQTREIEGWTIHFNETLFSEQKREVEIMLPLLHKQLAEIVRVVPPRALAQLRAIPIWVSPTYPNTSPKAEYHPGAEWLREHGRNPAMVKAVEITNVRTFAQETDRMPNFLLHELAHTPTAAAVDGGRSDDAGPDFVVHRAKHQLFNAAAAMPIPALNSMRSQCPRIRLKVSGQ